MSNHTGRAYIAHCLNTAGALRRRQIGYPWHSWSEMVEARRLLKSARLTRITGYFVARLP